MTTPTPEDFLEMYAHLVEGVDPSDDEPQALPMLFVDGVAEDGTAQHLAVGIVGAPPHVALPLLKEPLREVHPTALTFSTEAWSRTYDPVTGEEEAIGECVTILHVEADGSCWLLERSFVRTREGVRWLGEPRMAEQHDGRLRDALTYLLEA